MRFKRIFMIICLIVCIFSMASVCAGDANDTAIASETDINQATDDVIGIEEDTDLASSEENEILTANVFSFAKLNETINDNNEKAIYLKDDYKYSSGDERFERGIEITRIVTIIGNGHKIDGSGIAGMFNVKSENVTFIGIEFCNSGHTAITGGCTAVQCVFTDNNGDEGGAMNGGIAYKCIFSGNLAVNGGAMYNGLAQECNFTQNLATECGGATYGVSIDLCQFDKNYAYNDGGAVYNGTVANSTFVDNTAGSNGGAICDGGAIYSTFICNAANDGGAIYNGKADLCQFTGNSAFNDGGALYKCNSLYCNFTQNSAARDGGAVYDGGPFHCTFINNCAVNGGAVAYSTFDSCTFIDNWAYSVSLSGREIGGEGGAAYRCKATASTFTNNKADKKGGAMSRSVAFISTFEGNRENGALGAVYYGEVNLCTFGDGQLNSDTITVKQYNLTVADTTVGYNSGQKLDFYLIRDGVYDDTPINTTIKVYEDGRYVGTYYALTSNPYPEANYNGLIVLGWVVPLQKGDYVVELSADNVAGVKGASARLRVATATSIDASNITAVYNHDGTITAKLTYDDGKSPEGANLTVNVDGKTKTYTADKNGIIKISTKGLSAGTHTATINFASNDEYAKSSQAVKITIKKASTKLTAKAKTFKISDKTKKYTVTLKTDLNKVMKNTKVTIKVNKKTYSAKTNSKGVATFKLTKLTKKGKYTAVVKYAGSNNFNAKTVKVKITVK